MNKFEDYVDELVQQIAKNKYEILENFCKAYLAEEMIKNPDIKIKDLALVERRNGLELQYYFEKRSEK